jgi:hypothetical protein
MYWMISSKEKLKRKDCGEGNCAGRWCKMTDKK